MARERMVTRTVVATEVNALCLNIETSEPFNKSIILSGTFKDNKAVEKAAKKVIDTDIEKCVTIVDYKEKETLYGMTEQKFIEQADVLPPRVLPVKDAH
jgi:biotin synthase-like enzyme|nr:MAG TPA: hypothetical protein [Caudoviricetes sp.]